MSVIAEFALFCWAPPGSSAGMLRGVYVKQTWLDAQQAAFISSPKGAGISYSTTALTLS